MTDVVEEIKSEVKLLSRMLYKNKNQHRRGKYYQAMNMANRALKRLDAGELVSIDPFVQRAKSLKELTHSFQDIRALLRTMVEKMNQADLALIRCKFACQHLTIFLQKGWFLTFASVAMANLARIGVLCRQLSHMLLAQYEKESSEFLARVQRLAVSSKQNNQKVVLLAHRVVFEGVTIARGVLDGFSSSQVQISTIKQDDLGEPVQRETQPSKRQRTD